MTFTHHRADDPVTNSTRNDARQARQEQAKTEDSARIRAGAAAGRDTRSIGVTRTPYRRGR